MKWIQVSEARALKSVGRSWDGCLSGSGWIGTRHALSGPSRQDGNIFGLCWEHQQNGSPTGWERRGKSSVNHYSRPFLRVGEVVVTEKRWGQEGCRRSIERATIMPDGWIPPARRIGRALRRFRRQEQARHMEAVQVRRERDAFRWGYPDSLSGGPAATSGRYSRFGKRPQQNFLWVKGALPLP